MYVFLCSLSFYFSSSIIAHAYDHSKLNELSIISLTANSTIFRALSMLSLTNHFSGANFSCKVLGYCKTASFFKDSYACWMGASAELTSLKEKYK